MNFLISCHDFQFVILFMVFVVTIILSVINNSLRQLLILSWFLINQLMTCSIMCRRIELVHLICTIIFPVQYFIFNDKISCRMPNKLIFYRSIFVKFSQFSTEIKSFDDFSFNFSTQFSRLRDFWFMNFSFKIC